HRLTGFAQRGGGLADRFLLRAVARDVLMERHARQARRRTRPSVVRMLRTQLRAAAHAVDASLARHAFQVATERGRGGMHALFQLLERDEAPLLEQLYDGSFTFRCMHSVTP